MRKQKLQSLMNEDGTQMQHELAEALTVNLLSIESTPNKHVNLTKIDM